MSKLGSSEKDIETTQTLDFKISAGLKNIIGKELITDDFIAIFELVKNSYDANAKSVWIVFQNIKNQDGGKTARILIVDGGYGMSYDDLLEKWLFVGYSAKKYSEQPKHVDYRHKIRRHKRIFAGAKGIGRFSADRLGSKLRLYTKKEDEDYIHCMDINWKQFEADQLQEFHTIKVSYWKTGKIEIEDYPLKGFKKGTILEISSLNDKWDRPKLLKLKRYLQRLVNPSEMAGSEEFKIHLSAKEYLDEDKDKEEYDTINGPIKNVVFEKMKIKTTHLKCEIFDDKIKTTLWDKGKFIFSLEEKNTYPALSNIFINVFYLNKEAKAAFTRIMGIEPVRYGSIFLYKNGFRIHPYGNEGEDWLELDKRKTQGIMRYLANREVMGRVEIYGIQPAFQEVSSRDGGVIKTKAYDDLRKFIIAKVVRRLERYVVEGINWDTDEEGKRKSPEEVRRDSLELIQKLVGQVKDPDKNIIFNKELLDIFMEKQVEKLPELIKNVESLKKYVKSTKERKYIEAQLRAVRVATQRLRREKEEKEEALAIKEREALFLAGEVSADVKTLHNLTHAIGLVTDVIKGIIDDLNDQVAKGAELVDIMPLIQKIGSKNREAKLLAEIALKANFDARGDQLDDDIVFYIKQYVERVVGTRPGDGPTFRLRGDDQTFKRKFSIMDVSLMLDNFISNSEKAGANIITLSFDVKGKSLHIYIADNGKGIENKYEKQLFRRGFTTTRGAGIGMDHIRSIVGSMGGTVRFVGNNFKGMGKGACFEVVLP